MSSPIGEIVRLVQTSRSHVALTGAGISTESGIPDFRSPGGVWSKQSPVMYQDFLTRADERKRYWRMRRESYPAMRQAEPNPAHHGLTRFAQAGRLDLLVTQNIDGLHQAAGFPEDKLVEIHGTVRSVLCVACGRRYDGDLVHQMLESGIEDPRCDDCDGFLKSATVSFGQSLPREALERSFAAAQACDLFTVVGSSLVVEPAASIPLAAKQAGAALVLVNLSETPLDRIADVIVRKPCGAVFEQLLQGLDPAS